MTLTFLFHYSVVSKVFNQPIDLFDFPTYQGALTLMQGFTTNHEKFQRNGTVKSPACTPGNALFRKEQIQRLHCMLGTSRCAYTASFQGPKIVQMALFFVPGTGMTHILTIQHAAPDEYQIWQSWVAAYDLWEWIRQDSGPRNWNQTSSVHGWLNTSQIESYIDRVDHVTSGSAPWNTMKADFEDLFWHAFVTPEEEGIQCAKSTDSLISNIALWQEYYYPDQCTFNVNVIQKLCWKDSNQTQNLPCPPIKPCVPL